MEIKWLAGVIIKEEDGLRKSRERLLDTADFSQEPRETWPQLDEETWEVLMTLASPQAQFPLSKK